MSFSGISIALKEIRKRRGSTIALNGITAFFDAGRLHGLIGPDGAGKTTLIRTLMGLLKSDEGTITFSGPSGPIPFEEIRPFMAYMPQQQSLYADLSISEHLDFFRDLYQISPDIYGQKKAELLRLTRLEPFENRPAGKLSGGMYKKLGLMCALLQSPAVLLLDEPTNGVDPISRREFWELLYRLRDEGILIIISTAYMDEAERCSSVHLLDEGKIFFGGEPRAILQREGVANFQELFFAMKKAAVQ